MKRHSPTNLTLDPVIAKHFESLALKTGQGPQQIFLSSPWALIYPDVILKPLKKLKRRDEPSPPPSQTAPSSLGAGQPSTWLPLGTRALECTSSVRLSTAALEGWKAGTPLTVDVSVTFPRFMSKRVYRSSKGRITSGVIFRSTIEAETPAQLDVIEPRAHLQKCCARLRLVSASPSSEAVRRGQKKSPVKKTTLEEDASLGPVSFESYVASHLLESVDPAELLTALLLLIAPPTRLNQQWRRKASEFAGSNTFGSYSGNAFSRIMLRGRDIGRFDADVSNTLAVLVALDLIFVSVRLGEQLPPFLDLGDTVPVEATVSLSPMAFQWSSFAEELGGEAQTILRNASLTLLTRLVRTTRLQESLLSQVLREQSGETSGETQDSEPEVEGEEEEEELSTAVDEDEVARRNNVVFGEGVMDAGVQVGRPPQKRIFRSRLRKYQQLALDWMRARESPEDAEGGDAYRSVWDVYRLEACKETMYFNHMSGELQREKPTRSSSCRGGILADEMGLGKTVELLSLLSDDIDETTLERAWSRRPNGGGTLLIVPLSLVPQWTAEIIKHMQTEDADIRLHQYQSSERNRSVKYLVGMDMVITTYGTVLSDANAKDSPLFTIDWFRVVLDEAHYIKSRHTRSARAIFALKAERRWCLTGTPIQNGLTDVYSLFHFLRVEPWGHWSWWTKLTASDRDEKVATQRLQKVTEPILLRRTIKTTDPETGEPILTLPSKKVVSVWLEFTEEERDIYQTVFNRAVSAFQQYVADGVLAKNYIGVLHMLLRLRQVCCHPILMYAGGSASSSGLSFIKDEDDLNNLAEQLVKSLHPADPGGEKSKSFIKTQLRRLVPRANNALNNSDEAADETQCPICMDTPEKPVIAHCGHIMCTECAHRALDVAKSVKLGPMSARLKGRTTPCPVCRVPFSLATLKTLAVAEAGDTPWKHLLSQLVDVNDMTFSMSTKLRALLHIALAVVKAGYRMVVFSQWVTFLDILQELMRFHQIPTSRLDGSQNAKQRVEQIERFTHPVDPASPPRPPPPTFADILGTDGEVFEKKSESLDVEWSAEGKTAPGEGKALHPEGRILLASLKAGGVGLNLVAANYLVLMDSWWNPATEEQAMQRVYRIGQTKAVTIFRLYIKSSVEERILTLHQKKDTRARNVLGESADLDSAKPSKAWNLAEMHQLFAKDQMRVDVEKMT